MGCSPLLYFLHANQRVLDPNNEYLWVPDITCRVVHAIQHDWQQNNLCLLVPVVFACKTATFGAELQLSMGPRPHLSFSACKTAWIASEILVSMGPWPHLWFLDAKQCIFDQNYKSQWVPDLTWRFVYAKQRDLHQYDKSICFPDLICVFFHVKQRL